jgi:hypothetical protein
MPALIREQYSRLDAAAMFRQITPRFRTGGQYAHGTARSMGPRLTVRGGPDMHIAVYDFKDMNMYASNAAPYVNATKMAVPGDEQLRQLHGVRC